MSLTDKDIAELRDPKDPFFSNAPVDDLSVINKRLNELNKEFQELNTLKKEIQTKERKQKLTESFSKYKYILKNGSVEEFDFDAFLNNKNAQVGHSPIGLPIATDGVELYSVAETLEEAELRIKVDKLVNLTSELTSQFQPEDKRQPKKQYSVVEIYDEFVART